MTPLAGSDAWPCSTSTWCRQSSAGRVAEVLEGGHETQPNGGCSAQGLQGMVPAHSIAEAGLDPVGQCIAAQQYGTVGLRMYLVLPCLNRIYSCIAPA